jgi:hypothetical protein
MEKTKALMELEKELDGYRREGRYNVLVPTTTIQEISPFHKPVLEVVKINPDDKAGEVYEVVKNSGNYSLRAVTLNRIGYAAGLIWNAKGCGRTDDGTDPDIITYRAEAAVRKEDGTYMPLSAEYMLDLKVVEQELRQEYERKAGYEIKDKRLKEEDKAAWIEFRMNRDMLQKRKFRLQLAQTGAMGVVIRKILGLKGTYSKTELEKPFVVPKIAFAPDVSDPKVRELLLRQGMDATNALFGPAQERPALECQPRPGLKEEGPDQDVIDIESEGAAIPEAVRTDTAPKPPEEIPFDKMDREKQIEFLRTLMLRKGYDATSLKKPLEEFSDTHRLQFRDRLNQMEDKKHEEFPFD